MSIKQTAAPQRGVSLIELIIFIVIISGALAGILMVMNQVTAHSADPLVHKQALTIAESMLEEIQLQDLDPAPCAGALGLNAVRMGVKCITDYNGYSSTGIREFSLANAIVPGLESYNITSVAVTQIGSLGGTAINAGSGVMITVRVADPLGDTTEVTGYRAGN
jgi:MSHA pilin protein MshD